jgi:hypothetical protein
MGYGAVLRELDAIFVGALGGNFPDTHRGGKESGLTRLKGGAETADLSTNDEKTRGRKELVGCDGGAACQGIERAWLQRHVTLQQPHRFDFRKGEGRRIVLRFIRGV